MKRRIIEIDREKCNGCGACATACHEGAIGMVEGKAALLREDYCDGLGDCLPACPTGAITFEEREAPAYNEEAVKKAKAHACGPLPCGCPGSNVQTIKQAHGCDSSCSCSSEPALSRLGNWPVQIRLAPVNAPFSCPNNSESIVPSGIAPQLIAKYLALFLGLF